MREILFRGREWNADNEMLDFVYGYLTDYSVIKDEYGTSHVVHEETVCQFTGFFDKKENKIFEGDLLHTPGYYCEVKFIDGMFCSVYNHPEDGETLPLVDLSPERFEIIGNIYEN